MENTGKKDILSFNDVKLLVDEFYGKIRENEKLAPIFNKHIQDRWPEHLDKMYRFWQTILLGEHTYQGAPFAPHAKLPVEHEHFETWMKLFNSTVDELFTGNIAQEAKMRAAKMAEMFEMKIKYFRDNNFVNIQ